MLSAALFSGAEASVVALAFAFSQLEAGTVRWDTGIPE
jgi:hypothetical protein